MATAKNTVIRRTFDKATDNNLRFGGGISGRSKVYITTDEAGEMLTAAQKTALASKDAEKIAKAFAGYELQLVPKLVKVS